MIFYLKLGRGLNDVHALSCLHSLKTKSKSDINDQILNHQLIKDPYDPFLNSNTDSENKLDMC